MDIGIVLVAQDSDLYDYHRLAEYAGSRASRILGYPYTILEGRSTNKDIRKFPEGDSGPFQNNCQAEVMQESPYDVSIFIDADFIVNTDQLALMAESLAYSSASMYLLNDDSIEFGGIRPFNPTNWWSTVIIYKNNAVTKQVLEDVVSYGANWEYVKRVNNLHPAMVFRNDVAFALATKDLIANQTVKPIPAYQCLFTMGRYDPELRELEGLEKRIPIDVHAMNKAHLLKVIP
jgi:hypothetical protein